MKILLPLIILIVRCNSKTHKPIELPQKSHPVTEVRGIAIAGDSFDIVYRYDTGYYYEPGPSRYKKDSASGKYFPDTAAYRMFRHYFAQICVYKVSDIFKTELGYAASKTMLGDTIYGNYSPIQCCDYPEAWVEKAKFTQSIIDSNKVLRNKNGEYALYKYVVTWRELETGLDSGGLTIQRIEMSRDFLTAKEGHEFIDEQLRHIWSGLNFRLDSVLIAKRFKKPMTQEEYGVLEENRNK